MPSSEEQPMSIRTIKLLHSIPAIPGMPSPSVAPSAGPAKPAPPQPATRKLEIVQSAPLAPVLLASRVPAPLTAFYAAVFANTAEFCVLFLFQLLFGLGIISFPEADCPYVLMGLSGAVILTTLAALLLQTFPHPKLHLAIKVPHYVAYTLCCCWLMTFVDVCFLSLGLIPLLNLLLIAGWTAGLKRYSQWGCLPSLVLVWAASFFFYAISTPWYFALATAVVLSKQVALQSQEASQIIAAKALSSLPMSLSLRFWWSRFRASRP